MAHGVQPLAETRYQYRLTHSKPPDCDAIYFSQLWDTGRAPCTATPNGLLRGKYESP